MSWEWATVVWRPRHFANLSLDSWRLIMSDKLPTHLELVENAASDDPFDLSKLRVSQDFLESTNVRKLLTTVRSGNRVLKSSSACTHP